MSLNWNISPSSIHTKSSANTEYTVTDDVTELVEKATSLLVDTTKEDSQFFLVELNKQTWTVSITVTDSTKTKDSAPAVITHFVELEKMVNTENEIEWIENIQFAVSHCLTTDANFLNFSLIAMFTSEDRDYCQIL